MQNPDVFPIRMSIDIPDEKNLKSVVEYYLKDFTNEPLNFEEITQELLKIEKETGKKYNNSQIFGLPYLLADKIDKANPTQEEIIEYIKKDFAPLLDESDISKFNKEYEKFIGENN